MKISRVSRLHSGLVLVLMLGATPAAWCQVTPFLGQIMCAGFNFAPAGWLLAEGQLLSIAQNTALFALLGTQYGGDGQTTFALPDLRGRSMIGAGQSSGTYNYPQGEMAGAETVTLNQSQLPAHTHFYAPPASTANATVESPTGAVLSDKARTTLYTPANQANTTMATAQTSATGGTQPIPIRSPVTTVSCMIATQGVFPSRP